jgi:S1-C subfamily serine protease
LSALVEGVTPGIVGLSGHGDEFSACGSGFVIDRAGHVVTNLHVVRALHSPVDALLHGGIRQRAAIVGDDALTDLALLRLEGRSPAPLRLRRVPARLGEICLALGSPFGEYPESVALGVVSGVARTIEQEASRPIYHALQTDCAINPGNSGGPLIDARGEVIGVSNCLDSRAMGIGFAIPVETVRAVTAELIAVGKVVRASLGVSVIKRAMALRGRTVQGMEVLRVAREARGGLEPGDLIVRIEGRAVREPNDIHTLLTRDRIGKPIRVDVLRDGHRRRLSVRPHVLEA